MFVSTYAGAVAGIDAVKVTVEVNLTGGGLGLYLVGLPDNAVEESEQRIRAAFENTGRKMSGRKVVVNLAPADLRKEGAGFDLPIAVGILAAMSEVSGELLPTTMFAGELSLDGTLRPVRGVLPLAVQARAAGLRRAVVPAGHAAHAARGGGAAVPGAGPTSGSRAGAGPTADGANAPGPCRVGVTGDAAGGRPAVRGRGGGGHAYRAVVGRRGVPAPGDGKGHGV